MFSFSLCWVTLACLFNTGVKEEEEEEEEDENGVKTEDESESEPTIKEEPSEKLELPEAEYSSDLSEREPETESDDELGHDTQRKDQIMAPESGPPSEAAGSGTATENAEASGIQRRRSRLFREEQP